MPAQPVNAATKTINLTVRYKGKNVTFEAYRNMNTSKVKCTQKAKTYAAVKKAWGKANKVQKNGDYRSYIWKSGKTSISFVTDKKGKRMGDIVIDIQNKKATLCGIKVGMSKKQAYHSSSIAISLMVKLHGLEPYKYMKYILEQRPTYQFSKEELEKLALWSDSVQEICR